MTDAAADHARHFGWLASAVDAVWAQLGDGTVPLTLTVAAVTPEGQIITWTATARAPGRLYRAAVNPEDYSGRT
jgi:hypothetical protein